MTSIQDQFDNMFCDMKHSLAKLTIGREELADASVRQSDWRGDHCGFLAAQHDARVARGLTPTDDQLEAWLHENTESPLEAKLTKAEYFEER